MREASGWDSSLPTSSVSWPGRRTRRWHSASVCGTKTSREGSGQRTADFLVQRPLLSDSAAAFGAAGCKLARAGRLKQCPRMSITAIVENDTIKLPMHVPDGTKVEITLPGERTVADFDEWLATSTGLAKGRFTTDERMRETRGED